MESSSEGKSLERIGRNLAAVHARIAEAAARSSRAPDSVRLLAVTKYAGLAEMRALRGLGAVDFGEARVQEAEKKIAELAAPETVWHLIGHLQTNKAGKAARMFGWVHSIDSLRVAQALGKEREKLWQSSAPGVPIQGLLEVNIAGEANKTGLPPSVDALTDLLKACGEFSGVEISGLMCMAPHADNPEPTSRPVFRRLKELLEELNARRVYRRPLTQLSMGMTQDYLIAIEEGATIVRVGSALFE